MNAPTAIVLAAGEGSRMGGPKALLVVDGKPLVRAHVERLLEAGCRPMVVVRRGMAENVRAVLRAASGARIVASDTSSMAASLVVGLRHAAPTAGSAIVVSTVDCLPVRHSTLCALLHAVLANGAQVATPCYQGRGGHPVVARESLLQLFLRGYPGTLRDIIRAAETRRVRLEVDDPAVVADLDTPDDLAAARPGLVPVFARLGAGFGFSFANGAD
jgi:CTP:molybdopterin cytidylyltransferase MocA